MGRYVVRTVLMDGSTPVTAASAIPETISRTLNEPDSAAFAFPKHGYTRAQLPVLGGPSASIPSGAAEVQIYRNEELKFWGPIVSVDTASDTGQVSADLRSVDWYLFRRFIDGTRPNRLTNPSFEAGTAGWSATGGVTFTTTTDFKILGAESARLVSSTPNGDEFISQTFSETGTAIGTLLTAVAYFYVENITAQALDKRGLHLLGSVASVVQDADFYPIDTATPTNQWIRAELTIWVPPNQTWDIELRNYAPEGSILWDAEQVVAMDSVGTDGVELDVKLIFDEIIPHLQNGFYGKSNVNIGIDNETTGVTALKQYQFADHVQFEEALREFVDRDDVGDYMMEYVAVANGTSGTRTFKLLDGQRGTDLSGSVTLEYGVNVSSYRYQEDGSGVVTRATVLGEGDGPDREEGEYADASAIGGLTLQDVQAAPAQTQINSLLPQATEIVNERGAPIKLLEVYVIPDPDLIDTVDVGDIVRCIVDDGYVDFDGDFRIVGWELACRTDVLHLTLNEVT